MKPIPWSAHAHRTCPCEGNLLRGFEDQRSERNAAAFLDRECDSELRKWVDALLWAHDRSTGPASGDAIPAEPPQPPDADSTGAYNPDATGEFDPSQSTADLPAAGFPESSVRGTATYRPGAPSEATGEYSADPEAATKTFGSGGSLSPGESLLSRVIAGRYTLVEVIGEGGMGSVYLAEQTEPVKRQVALKLIKRGMDSRDVLARFDAERQALALMDHPNIARVYDGGTTPTGQPFFVMELVHGVPHHRVLRRAACSVPGPGWSCSSRSARRCSTPTRRGSSTAT